MRKRGIQQYVCLSVAAQGSIQCKLGFHFVDLQNKCFVLELWLGLLTWNAFSEQCVAKLVHGVVSSALEC